MVKVRKSKKRIKFRKIRKNFLEKSNVKGKTEASLDVRHSPFEGTPQVPNEEVLEKEQFERSRVLLIPENLTVLC